MGGTSTDVFHFDAAAPGGWERASETAIAGLTLQAPMLPIHTVAAGGGSVLQFDGQRLQVGPGSAGADPGPACYRRGGPLTITDANLLLGRLLPDCFPAVFGAHRDQPLDPEAVRRAFTVLAERVASSSGVRRTPEELAEGALVIAIDRMASAIHRISIQRGHDIRGATLVCFGGAGGQHACALADRMGILRVLLHPLAGVLSAYGMGLAERRLLRERPVRERLTADLPQRLRSWADGLIEAGREDLRRSDPSIGAVDAERTVALRVPASEVSLPVPLDEAQAMREAFGRSHHQRYGYLPAVAELVVERLVVELVAAAPEAADPAAPALPPPPPEGGAPPEVPLFIGGRWRQVPLLRREAMALGAEVSGPALIVEATGTNLLAVGWRARLLAGGELLFTAGEAGGEAAAEASEADPGGGGADILPPDPVRLELFNHRFAAIAEQMGVRLQQSARSVNIRERHDFSCAVFDGEGALVANAPHIPVHLGSMGESVAALLAAVRRGERPPLRPGDVVVSNDPSNGGTHLPDLTVITPVFPPEPEPGGGSGPAFFVASRGHHADVGGITPGSMPPFSRDLAEEGLLLDNVPLLRGGRLLEEEWRRRLAAGPHPVRDPDQLLADLQAQVAANRLGEQLLTDLARREGAAVVRAYMAYVQDNAAEAVRRVIERLEDGRFELPLDGGQRIAVAVRIDRQRRRARIDFSGTSAQDPGNLNAPLAITRAVVLYVFRCLVGEPIPLNAGCFRPLDLVVPQGCLLHPGPTAAVVAGNVETSQAIANALFGALGVLAAGQGTMNNLSFGNARCQYYETIAGGSGAGDGFAGAAAVQTHMTNSRLTDPEILEERFPVRVETFALRRGSGGAGRWSGGDGLVRRLRFLEPMTVALPSGSRRVAPFALAGGRPGLVGRNRLEHADGRVEELSGSAQLEVSPGDALLIETPGGGGYGAP
jgi:5-oxoprolinase (ATP-hydrolysing)